MMQHVKTFLVVASVIASVGCATGRKMAYEPDFVDLVRSGRVQKAELHRTDGQAAIAVAHLNEPTGAHGTIRVQVPDLKAALRLFRKAGVPVTVPPPIQE